MNKEQKLFYKEIITIVALFFVVGVVIGMIFGMKIGESETDECAEHLERAAIQIEHCVDSYKNSVEFNHRLLDIITHRNCNNE